MRPIDADALWADVMMLPHNGDIISSEEVEQVITDAPTIDAAPIRRGKWKLNKDGSGTCDQCHCTQAAVWDMDNWQNFCGHCGADMREVI